ELIGEINQVHAQAVKAQEAAVHHALEVGRKLNLAHRLLARLRTKLRKRRLEAPPTWEEWVEINLKFSVRTAYYYRTLDKHRKEITPHLGRPGVSIRKLVRMIGKPLEDERAATPPDAKDAKGDQDQTDPFDYKCALAALRDEFREITKTWWPKEVVLYLLH